MIENDQKKGNNGWVYHWAKGNFTMCVFMPFRPR